MATWKDVHRIALALPETTEINRGTAAWAVRDKVFAWERPLRPADIKALGKQAPRGSILAVRVDGLVVKEARLAAQPASLFTTPHFDGFPAGLEELLVEAWLVRAPKRVAREYLTDTGSD